MRTWIWFHLWWAWEALVGYPRRSGPGSASSWKGRGWAMLQRRWLKSR